MSYRGLEVPSAAQALEPCGAFQQLDQVVVDQNVDLQLVVEFLAYAFALRLNVPCRLFQELRVVHDASCRVHFPGPYSDYLGVDFRDVWCLKLFFGPGQVDCLAGYLSRVLQDWIVQRRFGDGARGPDACLKGHEHKHSFQHDGLGLELSNGDGVCRVRQDCYGRGDSHAYDSSLHTLLGVRHRGACDHVVPASTFAEHDRYAVVDSHDCGDRSDVDFVPNSSPERLDSSTSGSCSTNTEGHRLAVNRASDGNTTKDRTDVTHTVDHTNHQSSNGCSWVEQRGGP